MESLDKVTVFPGAIGQRTTLTCTGIAMNFVSIYCEKMEIAKNNVDEISIRRTDHDLNHADPPLPLCDGAQGRYSTLGVSQETRPLVCRLFGVPPGYMSGIIPGSEKLLDFLRFFT